MITKTIIASSRNGVDLHVEVDQPAYGEPKAFALFSHCFTCSSELGIVRNFSKTLVQKGIGVVRFDFTGLGKSQGSFEASNFSSNVTDILDVYQFLEAYKVKPTILIGHSLGGTATLLASSFLKDQIKAIVTIGSPSEPDHVAHLFGEEISKIKSEGQAQVSIGGRPFFIQEQFITDLKNHNLQSIVSKLKIPYLIMHSPQDTIVSIDNAAQLYNFAHHPKSFISLDHSDHLLSRKQDATYAAEVMTSWVSKYVDYEIEPHIQLSEDHQMIGHIVLGDGFETMLQTQNHTLLADEPKEIGGLDLGPAPYDLLNSALAACTVMTMKMYADRKKWPLKEAFVYINHSKIQDPENENTNDKIDFFTKEIKLVGELDEKQRARLIEIAAKCPVQKTLTNTIHIKTTEINE